MAADAKRATKLLRDSGAVLVRQKRHAVWRLPNGRIVVISATPGGKYFVRKQNCDIKRAMRAGVSS
jgi:predicted RNA binding protein YcfA (HicA-like mRNA interferase family)